MGCCHNLVTLPHLPQLDDANGQPLQLLDMVFLLIRLRNSHFRVPFIFTKHLAASMIISMELLDRHVSTIRCMEDIVETTPWHSLNHHSCKGGQKKPMDGTPTDPDTETLYWSSIQAAQTIRVPTMTDVTVLVRLQFPDLIHTERAMQSS